MSRPLLILGLDGASWEALDLLMATGDLPTLAALADRGLRAVTQSVVPPITPAAWASFMTGKRPGTHGIYDFRLYDPRNYGDTFVTSRALRDRTLWQILTAAGRRVATVGVPLTYPPPADVGTVVSGFDTPSTAAAFTNPPELRGRILERFPDYAFVATPDRADPSLTDDATFECFVAEVERVCEQRTRVALDVVAQSSHDVLMVHHQDVDALQHATWRFVTEPSLHPTRAARLRQAYRRIDALLGEIVAAMPADTLTLVVSDHGFGTHDGRLFPNVLLRTWGYLRDRARRRERFVRSMRKHLARLRFGPAARRQVPWDERVRERGFRDALPVSWSRTRAYVAVAEIYGLLYLNLRGREPDGIVAPGEADALRADLTRRFRGVRDPRDGAPCFVEVLAGENVYPDDPHGRRPDLVLVPRPGYSVYRDLNDRMWITHYDVRGGTHRPEGVVMLSGAGVRRGRLDHDVELVDLAPTLLAVAGVPVPEDMEGRVLVEAFIEPLEVTYASPAARMESVEGGLSAAEEDEVTERLRALGYLA